MFAIGSGERPRSCAARSIALAAVMVTSGWPRLLMAEPAAIKAPRKVALAVDCRAKGRTISPAIYGMAGDLWESGITTRRWGGNPTSRYNWQLGDAYNAAKDWFFENGAAEDYRHFIAENQDHHVTAALTVPMIGWVAKDKTSYGFPISVYGPQHAQAPDRKDAGDGVRPDGVQIRPRDPALTSVPSSPESIRKWIEAINAAEKTPGSSVQMYILDNEPSLWNSTHRDVHPDPVSYDELLERTVRYASAIRQAAPGALIAGPAEWGWTGYFYSAQDAMMGIGMRPDRRAHGDVPLIPWYLQKLRAQQKATGVKLLDVLDVHFYPQADGVYAPALGGRDPDPKSRALRLRSTRALWDPSYKDESWIGEPVRLIPRLKAWVADNYPGLKVSLGEYSFGAELDMSGGLAEAEALGRFGTEGLDYAYYWLKPPKDSPVYWAFRAYRNFDGRGGRFLDRSVPTRMGNGVSLFASRDESGKHFVLVALNLDPDEAAEARIELNGCGPVTQRKAFAYHAGSNGLTEDASSAASDSTETLLPYSINVFDILVR